jgi:hypothetical protein
MIGTARRVLPALMAGLTAAVVAGACTLALHAQAPAPPQAVSPVKGVVPASQPAWSKGIQAINRDSYYHAIECGKQGGAQPSCVFYDADLCKNDDFAIAMYTPYKQVAYEVWQAVRKKQPAPQPNYQAAQRQRVTIGITPVKGSTNGLTNLVLRRGGKPVTPVDGSVASARWTFDYAALAPSTVVTLAMIGKTRTVSCVLDEKTLASFR